MEVLAGHLLEEARPAVRYASSAAELDEIPLADPLVLGFFNKSDIEEGDRDSTGPYAVFQVRLGGGLRRSL